MLRYRDGDKDSFEILYQRYEKPLMDFIYRMVMNASEAENLYQETFYRVIRSKMIYKVTAQFKTLLFQIAANLCRDRLRRLKHRSHLSLNSPVTSHNDSDVELQQLIADPSSDVVKQMESDELVSLIKDAIASLFYNLLRLSIKKRLCGYTENFVYQTLFHLFVLAFVFFVC